jgi:hypothetical protein
LIECKAWYPLVPRAEHTDMAYILEEQSQGQTVESIEVSRAMEFGSPYPDRYSPLAWSLRAARDSFGFASLFSILG